MQKLLLAALESLMWPVLLSGREVMQLVGASGLAGCCWTVHF